MATIRQGFVTFLHLKHSAAVSQLPAQLPTAFSVAPQVTAQVAVTFFTGVHYYVERAHGIDTVPFGD